MGIVNGPAPEDRATRATDWMTSMTMERDALQVQLQQSEQLRTEAFAACETMRQELEQQRRAAADTCEALRASNDELRQELVVITQERDEWKAAAEYQQQQATQLRQQLADLQAQLDAAKNEASKSGWVVVGSHLPDREQLDTEIVRLTNNWGREIDERKALQAQVAELQAQLEAATVTPAQQPDGNAAERLEMVRRMIGEIWGWYACVECLGEQSAETWEQVGALLGHLQREAG